MPRMSRNVRADQLALEQHLGSTLTEVRAMIVAGEIRSGDQVVLQPSQLLSHQTELRRIQKEKYVSRGGYKLEAILLEYNIPVRGQVAADIGASTGGFTDCLLQFGSSRVYAIDAGYGQLAYKLRTDSRVVEMERTNARYLEQLPELMDIVTIDVSFISLTHLFPVAASVSSEDADVIALVKPQFEAEKDEVDRRGVVFDNTTRRLTVERVYQYALDSGLLYQGMLRSPLTGPAGNEEFLLWLKKKQGSASFSNDLRKLFSR